MTPNRPHDDDIPTVEPAGDVPVVEPVESEDEPRRRRPRRRGPRAATSQAPFDFEKLLQGSPEAIAQIKKFVPPIPVVIAQVFGIFVLMLTALLVTRGGVVWVVGLAGIGVAMLAVFATLMSSSGGKPSLRLPWHLCFGAACFLLWTVAARPDRRADVLIENGSAQDVVLEIDGRAWATCKRSDTANGRVPKRKFVLVTKSAATGQVLDQRELDATHGYKFLLNVLGKKTYYEGEVHYVPMALARMPRLGGSPSDAPRENRSVWINLSGIDYLFTDIPRQSREMSSKRYLLRYRPNLN
jgi:hypothetical protein